MARCRRRHEEDAQWLKGASPRVAAAGVAAGGSSEVARRARCSSPCRGAPCELQPPFAGGLAGSRWVTVSSVPSNTCSSRLPSPPPARQPARRRRAGKKCAPQERNGWACAELCDDLPSSSGARQAGDGHIGTKGAEGESEVRFPRKRWKKRGRRSLFSLTKKQVQ